MAQVSLEQLRALRGGPVYDSAGRQVGEVGEIWLDEDGGQPRYLKIARDAFGGRAALVPLDDARAEGDGIHVPYSPAELDGSPDLGDVDADLDDARQNEILGYYGNLRRRDDAEIEDVARTHVTDADVSVAREADTALTRSEEELVVGKESVAAGAVRVRKWVETEPVELDVDLRRETARISRQPIDETVTGVEIGEEEIEIPLRAEEAVVEKHVVAKERITVDKDVEIESATITEEVRRERVDVEDVGDTGGEDRGY